MAGGRGPTCRFLVTETQRVSLYQGDPPSPSQPPSPRRTGQAKITGTRQDNDPSPVSLPSVVTGAVRRSFGRSHVPLGVRVCGGVRLPGAADVCLWVRLGVRGRPTPRCDRRMCVGVGRDGVVSVTGTCVEWGTCA